MLTTHFWLALPNSLEGPEVVVVEAAEVAVEVVILLQVPLHLHTAPLHLHPDPVVVAVESK